MRDDLATWCRIREQVDWAAAARPVDGPVTGLRDGIVDFVRGPVAARDPARAVRLLTAVGQARATALPLSYELLAGWQATVLGVPEVGFRRGPAYAKGGRERYGLAADTAERFRRCLAQAADAEPPLAARAARAYLDVAFFHPFPDGNGRAAMLALDAVLRRHGVVLDQVAPILLVARRADDPDGARGLAGLIDVLIAATRRRARRTPHSGRWQTASTLLPSGSRTNVPK
ncbi:Fic family protein [Micromonospora sp. NPDC004540]|uniref:Fic family protein n=1 Tax=Micromonospora sp. NPDC004540 TaxID=3154457 RepID=UPI0033B02736